MDINLTGHVWGMPVDFIGQISGNATTVATGDSFTNWIAVIIAFGSLVAFFMLTKRQVLLMNTQTEIQQKQADISKEQLKISTQQLLMIQNQNEERINNLKKANLRYKFTNDSSGYEDLIIINDGPSEARNIEIKLNGKPLTRCPFPVMPNSKIERLLPNAEFRYNVLAGVGVPFPTKITLCWSDDFGANRELEGDLSYVESH